MISLRVPLVFSALCSISSAAIHSGHAAADWLAASSSYEAGKTVKTGIRLVMDKGWHTYWSNPGEGGMQLSVKWELPEGWTAGEVEHPVPIRFMTGDLPGFGYEGTVIFPVTLTPPAGASGSVTLKAKVSWLTCNDSACIPGNADLEMTLDAGKVSATPDSGLLAEASKKVPVATDEIILKVTEKPKFLVLTLTPADSKLIATDTAFFPATPDVVDAGAEIRFTKSAEAWTAEVPKSEYLSDPVKEFTLVSGIKDGTAPLAITWKSE